MAKVNKQLYNVKIEARVPIELFYKVYAENPEEAIELVSKNAVNQYLNGNPKIKYSQVKKLKGTVYKFGSIIIEKIKNF